MRLLPMDPGHPSPLPLSVQFVCEERLCRVRIDFDSGARLQNQPLLGPTPEDAEIIRLGEVFQIEGQGGTYRIERLSGEANALVLNRVS